MSQQPFDYLHRTITLTQSSGTPLKLATGLAAQLYAQHEDTQDEKGQPSKIKRGQRVLLTALNGNGDEKSIVTLDIGIGKDGRLANLPDTIEIEKNADALEYIANADSNGLTLYGAELQRDQAKSKSIPRLLDSADGRMHVYFRGANDKFLCAQLDTTVRRAEHSTPIGLGLLVFTAKQPGVIMNHAAISIEPTQENTAAVQIVKDARIGKGAPEELLLKKKEGNSLSDLSGDAIAFNDQWLACGDAASNKVFIFARSVGNWQYLKALTHADARSFGKTVTLNRGYCAVGDPEADKVYLYQAGQWDKAPTVLAPDSSQDTHKEGFGTALACKGDFLAVGAPKARYADIYRLAAGRTIGVLNTSDVNFLESPFPENRDRNLKTAVEFKGAKGSYTSWPHKDTLDPPSLAFDSGLTLEFWARYTGTRSGRSVMLLAEDKNNQQVVKIHLPYAGYIYFDAGNGSYDRLNKRPDDDFFAGEWLHWTFVKNVTAGRMEIYKNGQLWHSATGKTRSLGHIDRFFLGSQEDKGYYWKGTIDGVRFWNRPLTAATIKKNQYLVVPKKTNGLLLNFPEPLELLYLVPQKLPTTIKVTNVDASLLNKGESEIDFCTLEIEQESKREIWQRVPRAAHLFTAVVNGKALPQGTTLPAYQYSTWIDTTELIEPAIDNGGSQLLEVVNSDKVESLPLLNTNPQGADLLSKAPESVQAIAEQAANQVQGVEEDSQAIFQRGCVYLYSLSHQKCLQLLPGFIQDGEFGSSLDLQGDGLIVGAPGDEEAKGAAYVYRKSIDGFWWQYWEGLPRTQLEWPTDAKKDKGLRLGSAVAIRGSLALVSCPTLNRVFIYALDALQKWTYKGALAPAEGHVVENFGSKIALGGNSAAHDAAARADILVVSSTTSDKAFVYYKRGPEAKDWEEEYVSASGKAVALLGEGLALASAQQLSYYTLFTVSERWAHVPRQLDHFLAVMNGAATDDPGDLNARHGKQVLYDYQNMHFVYSLPIVEGPADSPAQKGNIRLMTRYIKGSAADLDPLNESIVNDTAGAEIKASLQSDGKVTLTIRMPIVYRLYKTELDSNSAAIEITETWINLPTEAWKIVKILNGKGNELVNQNGEKLYYYNDASTTDSQVANLSGGSELLTAAIDGVGYSQIGRPQYDKLAVETAQGLTPPRSTLPYGSSLFGLSVANIAQEDFKLLNVVDQTTKPIPRTVPGLGLGWREEAANRALSLNKDQAIALSTSAHLDNTGDVCIEAWIHPQNAPIRDVSGSLLEYHQPEISSYRLGLEKGRLVACRSVAGQQKDSMTLDPIPQAQGKSGEYNWTHVAAAYQSSYALEFARSLYLDCGANEAFDLDKGITLEAWVKTPDASKSVDGTLISKWGDKPYKDEELEGKSWWLNIENKKAVFSFSTKYDPKTPFEIKNNKALSHPNRLYYISAFMDINERNIQALKLDGNTEIEAVIEETKRLTSLAFNGNSSIIKLSNNINQWPSDATIEFWIYINDIKDATIVDFQDDKDKKLSLRLKNSKLFLATESADDPTDTKITLEASKWIHLAITKDTIYKYVNDAKLVEKKYQLANNLKDKISVFVGADSENQNYFNGAIAELRIWKNTQAKEDIKSLRYNTETASDKLDKPIDEIFVDDPNWVNITPGESGPEVTEQKGPINISSEFTIEFWAKRSAPSKTNQEWVLVQKDQAHENNLYVGFKKTGPAFGWGKNSADLETFEVKKFNYQSDTNWHHYAFRLKRIDLQFTAGPGDSLTSKIADPLTLQEGASITLKDDDVITFTKGGTTPSTEGDSPTLRPGNTITLKAGSELMLIKGPAISLEHKTPLALTSEHQIRIKGRDSKYHPSLHIDGTEVFSEKLTLLDRCKPRPSSEIR